MNTSAPLDRKSLAAEMLAFARQIPTSAGLEWVKDYEFLYHFEAERLLTMRQALLDSGFSPDQPFRVLDFGYLHGIVPEFLHRFFPKSEFTVLDHPESPNFTNPEYWPLISSRSYLTVKPCLLEEAKRMSGQFDLIILGEIIEHLDPTIVARAFADLHPLCTPTGRMLITTPNAGSMHDTVLTLLGHDTQHPPIAEGTMGYPHIHLWSHPLLQRTLEHYGWCYERVYYNHGFGSRAFAQSNRSWGSFKGQLLTKFFHFSAHLRPRWREFMVSTWKPVTPP